MTNPNWWDVEPYYIDPDCTEHSHCSCGDDGYNVPLIIAEVEKRGETTAVNLVSFNECRGCFGQFHDDDVNFCPHCGKKIIWP